MTQDLFVGTLERWIGVVMHNSMVNLTRYAREKGFSVQQLMALNFISRHESFGVSDLGEKMGVTSGAASQLLDKLVQQGLVLRTEDPKDRRSKQIALTAKGERVMNETSLARSSWLSELEGTLSQEEHTQTLTALNLLIDKASEIGRTPESEFGVIS